MQCSVLYAIVIVLSRALQHISYIYRNMENRKWIIGMSLCMDVFIAKSKKGVHIIRSQPPLIKFSSGYTEVLQGGTILMPTGRRVDN